MGKFRFFIVFSVLLDILVPSFSHAQEGGETDPRNPGFVLKVLRGKR
jgi:hypothetical protein